MIYTVTFNPAIDYYMRSENILTGATNRSSGEKIYFGGKGINVSLVLSELGVPSAALGFIAGFTGDALSDYMCSRGVRSEFIKLKSGNTRINVKLKSDCITEINADGPTIDPDAVQALFEKLGSIKSGDTLVLAGSVPKSMPQDIYEKILSSLEGRGVRTVVDATKALLLNTLKYKPFLIKPNLSELEEIVGEKLETDEKIALAAKKLADMGAENVLVSMGGDGALLLASDGKVYRGAAVGGKPVNTVGAGDSMVAGFIAGVPNGFDYALKLGLAAGGATACSEDLAVREEIYGLMEK